MDFIKQKGQKIGVFGLGITGVSVYRSLVNVTKELIVYDDAQNNRESFSKAYGDSNLIDLDNERWIGMDKIVISPGVPHSHFIFNLAISNNIPITSDIELFIEENPQSEYVFITGTNGKSTVTSLIGHILVEAGLDYHVGGNIGKVVADLPRDSKGYVLELSSFQIDLLNIDKMNPKISVITNIAPDHMDRYNNIEDYAKAKEKIFKKNALKVIGVNSPISRDIYNKFKSTDDSLLIPVSVSEYVEGGVFCNNEYLADIINGKVTKFPMPVLSNLEGVHNKENIAIAYAVCKALLVNESLIVKALESFKTLAHRMEYIGDYKNLSFYNDSKATNISSALASLSSFQNIIWFAGGKFKEESFESLTSILKNIKKAYFFGESKNLFADFFEHNLAKNYEICSNLEDAFTRALKYSLNEKGRLVFLLAPACASYDQFKNFEERGQLFVKLVKEL